MGIRDRDYMKGGSDEPAKRAMTDEAVEPVLTNAWRKHKRVFQIAGMIFVLLLLAGVVLALSGK